MNAKNQINSYLPKAGLYLGIIGTVSLLFFAVIFLEDWTHRYTWMWFLVPVPVVFLFVAGKLHFIGGLLLVILGIAVIIFDINNSPGNPWPIAGKGLGYTIVFVSIPLILSGVSYIFYNFKLRRLLS
jgi:hypothetical protein